MSTGAIPARATASNTACTNERPAGNPAMSEVWLRNTWPVCITATPPARTRSAPGGSKLHRTLSAITTPQPIGTRTGGRGEIKVWPRGWLRLRGGFGLEYAWNAAGRDEVCIRVCAGQRGWRVIVVTVL